MSYTFTGSGTKYLRMAGVNSLGASYPLSMFCRAKSSDGTVLQCCMTFIRASGTYNGQAIYCDGTAVGDMANAHSVQSSATYNDAAWHGISGISSGTTSHTVNNNDTADSNSTSVTIEAYDDILVGARLTPSIGLQLNGDVCSAALWSAALTADECKALNAGFPAYRVRPQSLRFYAPLIRDLQVRSNKSSVSGSMSATGSPSVSVSPRMYGF